MKRPKGMALPAFQAYIRACSVAKINPAKRVMQTLGFAEASAGTHGRDGTLNGEDYSAAVDLRTKDLSAAQIRALLKALAEQGFCAWYRFEGSFSNNRHIHAIFCGLPMKPSLRRQVQDFLRDRNGLANHAAEKFYTAPKQTDLVIQAMYLNANPGATKVVMA